MAELHIGLLAKQRTLNGLHSALGRLPNDAAEECEPSEGGEPQTLLIRAVWEVLCGTEMIGIDSTLDVSPGENMELNDNPIPSALFWAVKRGHVDVEHILLRALAKKRLEPDDSGDRADESKPFGSGEIEI